MPLKSIVTLESVTKTVSEESPAGLCGAPVGHVWCPELPESCAGSE